MQGGSRAGHAGGEGVVVGPPEKDAVWSALNSLASAPVEQRTMTGLSVLPRRTRCAWPSQPYVLGGAHGENAACGFRTALGDGAIQCFEMEEGDAEQGGGDGRAGLPLRSLRRFASTVCRRC